MMCTAMGGLFYWTLYFFSYIRMIPSTENFNNVIYRWCTYGCGAILGIFNHPVPYHKLEAGPSALPCFLFRVTFIYALWFLLPLGEVVDVYLQAHLLTQTRTPAVVSEPAVHDPRAPESMDYSVPGFLSGRRGQYGIFHSQGILASTFPNCKAALRGLQTAKCG
jgi:hypothetical protein